jgi:cellulose synthase/poly-beta-1,6-N-acetylglucosamine synthase-like glycosyltransferase
MKPSLSVVVITHNEEANIARCLGSVKPIVSPATSSCARCWSWTPSSDDATVKVAKRLGPGGGEALAGVLSAQKNWALARVKGDWVLSLDADEER